MKEKVVLAYSGGLDTTALIPWMKEPNFPELPNYILKILLMISVTIM